MILIGFLIGQQYSIFVWVGVFVMILSASWLVSRFSLQYHFMLLLALLLPFSIETSINENLNINLPTEPMLAIAAASLCWDVLRKPGLIKQLFGNESLWVLPLLLGIFNNSFLQLLKTNQYLSHNTNSGMLESLESSGNISSDISNLERM